MPVKFDLTKIEQLLANATNPKQKAMYEALLTRAKQQQNSSKPEPPSVESPVRQVEPTSEPTDKAPTPQVKEERCEDITKKKRPQQDVEKHRTKKRLSISLTQKPQTNTAEPELPPAFFQAIGVVTGVVHLDEDRSNTLNIGEKSYPLLYSAQKRFALKHLNSIIKQTGETKQRLIVYPQVVYFPKLEQPFQMEPPRAKAPRFLKPYKTKKLARHQALLEKEQKSPEQVEVSIPQAKTETEESKEIASGEGLS